MNSNLKQKVLYFLTTLIIVSFILFNIIDNKKNLSVSQTYFYMGTIIDISLYGTDNLDYLSDISKMINDLDNTFSRNITTSEVSKINLLEVNEKLVISEDTFNVIEKSLEYSSISNGYFDITVNPLVNLWKIGTEDANIPLDKDIQEVIQNINYKDIILDKTDSSVSFKSNLSIDLGAIAKGYVADKIVNYLEKQKIEKATISIGGNVYVVGTTVENSDWAVGIRHPELNKSSALLSLDLNNKSVVTSGIYERYFEEDNKIYHHILNPFTGYPVENEIISITIISSESIDGDALSTALFCLGKDEAIKAAKSLTDISVIIITKDKNIYTPAALNLTLFDEEYKLIEYK